MVFLVAYVGVRNRSKGPDRFKDCYTILALGTITELLLAIGLSYPVYDVLPAPPPAFSLNIYIMYMFFMALWSFIPWLDLVSQGIKL